MGDPRRMRKKYNTPLKKWDILRIPEEVELIKKYGLKNKKELWRVSTTVSNIRGIARSLFSAPEDVLKKRKAELFGRLEKFGLYDEKARLDDVLGLKTEDMLERRLQTIVFKKGLSKSVDQARQFIVHGHIALDGKKVTVPGYLVPKNLENKVSFYISSSIATPGHPIRE